MEDVDLLKLVTSGSKELKLLRAIDEMGSISKAAECVGVSYRTAWEYVNRINRVFAEPVVVARAGGREGGGTSLSPSGRIVLEAVESLRKEIERVVGGLGEKRLEEVMYFLRRVAVRTSARNQIFGKVIDIKRGDVVSVVSLESQSGDVIYALLTTDSLEALGIENGSECYALIKAPWIIVSKDSDVKLSARNMMLARITDIKVGAVNSEINMKTTKGLELTAIITNESKKELDLREGEEVTAIFKASHVILGV